MAMVIIRRPPKGVNCVCERYFVLYNLLLSTVDIYSYSFFSVLVRKGALGHTLAETSRALKPQSIVLWPLLEEPLISALCFEKLQSLSSTDYRTNDGLWLPMMDYLALCSQFAGPVHACS